MVRRLDGSHERAGYRGHRDRLSEETQNQFCGGAKMLMIEYEVDDS
jgi:hypothetical protein